MYFNNSNLNLIKDLLNYYGIQVNYVGTDEDIPHSIWGNPEIGRVCEQLYIRGDHSILHEASHYVCIQAHQRSLTQVDAKGTAMEENSTCYLQLVLSDLLRAIVDRSIWKIWIIGL